jgi:hypothetical protein
MLRKKSEKKISEMESFFEEILVCNDTSNRPFLEVFVHEPENIMQKDLGTLLGIFEINDTTEDSSYIVNYLISVIKKEYFSRPKRGPVESFEAALHKANLALAKLAEYGNINWIGKINAICAVTERQNLHLTQTGNTMALMLRKGYLTNISEDLSPDNLEPNPLKTFVNISSGKLEDHDKIIVLTDNIFDVLDPEEIKNNALNFSEKDFIQFLKTVLANRLEKAAALVIDIKEKKEVVLSIPQKTESLNAFSSSAFSKTSSKREPMLNIPTTEAPTQLPPPEEAPKIGHIYIKESSEPEKIQETFLFSFFKKKHYSDRSNSVFRLQAKKVGEKMQILLNRIKDYPLKEKLIRFLRIFGHILAILFSSLKKSSIWIINKSLSLFRRSTPIEVNIAPNSLPAEIQTEKITALSLRNGFRFLPNFSLIKTFFSRMSRIQKFYALGAVFLIFVVPFFIVKIQKNITEKKLASQVVETVPVIVPLENEPNLTRLENLNPTVNFSEEITRLLNVNNQLFALSSTKIFNLESREEFPVPESFENIQAATGMDDLNLIILVNSQGKALSFSPVSKKFQANNLNIPPETTINLAGTYLTYLYLADTANNQIYRYPRAEGGFGEKTNWKKDATDISASAGIAINENIYLVEPGNLLKFFRGQKQDFAIEESPTKIQPFKVVAKIDGQNIWLLDKANSRVVKLDLNGKIIAQYYHPEIANTTDFAVNEETNTAYFSAKNSVQSFLAN